jgi:thiol-disulfide isomerase/thioredoxin
VPVRWLKPPLALLLAACTAGLAGCTTAEVKPPTAAEDAASPFAGCATLTAPPEIAAASLPASAAGTGAADLPAVSLPCFTGGQSIDLAQLRGPAVVNLWASSCEPCRDELPLMQELADRTAGRLHVVGVDTFDRRAAAASFATDHGVSFPTLFDPKKKLITALGKVNLPVTVFLGADGGQHVYTGKALDKPTLGALVKTHTGVTVTE